MQIGAQFYTVREQCQTLEGLSESLKRAADIGYRTVQISGTCAYEPEWLREELQKNGLTCAVTHTAADTLADDTGRVIAGHEIFGCRYIGLGMMPGALHDPADYGAFTRRFRPAMEKIRAAGKLFLYHNHQFEFMRSPGGKIYLERMMEEFPAGLLGFTFDTYWAQYGGADPAQWLERLSGRVPCIHVKDMACVDAAPSMAPVGEGNLNWSRILAAAEQAGTQYVLVEQDDCHGEDPFDCLRRSYAYLRSLGLE